MKWLIALATSGLMVAGQGMALAGDAPKMKMTTDIPATITAPEKVDTSIGTLNYFDGIPTNEHGRRST